MGLTFNLGRVSPSVFTDSSLNVGIGAAPSGSYKLEVTGSSRINATQPSSIINYTDATSYANLIFTELGTNKGIIQYIGSTFATTSRRNNLEIVNGANADMTFWTNNTTRMTITSAGNVGIGTSSPQINLHLLTGGTAFSSTTTYSSSTSRGILLEQSNGASSNGNAIWFNNSGLYSAIASTRESTGDWGTDLRFFTHPTVTSNQFDVTERMRITSGGNVLIGTSTDRSLKLVVEGTDNNNLMGSYNTTSGSSLRLQSNQTINYIVSSGTNMLDFQVNGAVSVRFINSGGVSIGTTTDYGYKLNLNGQPGCNGYTAWTNWSDLRLKENVTDLEVTNVLDKICTIRPVTYNYNELSGFDEATRSRRISGFIAQELMEVFPDMVGTIKKGDDEYYDTNLSNLTLYLVKAIQELNERLNKAGL